MWFSPLASSSLCSNTGCEFQMQLSTSIFRSYKAWKTRPVSFSTALAKMLAKHENYCGGPYINEPVQPSKWITPWEDDFNRCTVLQLLSIADASITGSSGLSCGRTSAKGGKRGGQQSGARHCNFRQNTPFASKEHPNGLPVAAILRCGSA